MFKCKVCTEKDKRILELYNQIEFLKTLTIPSNTYPEVSFSLPDTPSEDVQELVSDIQKRYEEQQKDIEEREQILSGDY